MEKSEILLSVIVPVYNGANVVEKLTASVLAVKRNDLELILVDDGSTDETPVVCRKIAEADPRCKALRQENQGVSAARNTGLKAARGKYIYFCDCDDDVIPEALETGMELAEKTGYDVYLFDYIYNFMYNDRGQVRQRFEIPQKQMLGRQEVIDLMLATLLLKAGTGQANLWNKFFSVDVIRNNQIHFEEKVGKGEDWRFLVDCFDIANSAYYLPEILYIYNLDGTQTEKKYKKVPGNHLLGADIRRLTFLKKYGFDLSEKRECLIYQSILSHVAYSAVNGCEKRELLAMMQNPTVLKAAKTLCALPKKKRLEYGILRRDKLCAFCVLHRKKMLLKLFLGKFYRFGES